ncbi:MAG: MFS transporter [Treponema sp.]|nr:MFS transporter [Treponema sp.]MBR6914435.1 MFS transporter [Treponema sp.]
MASLLLAVIYLIFMSLGLPDSLLGAGWPTMHKAFGVSSSYAGYVSMTIAFMTIISALLSPKLIQKVHTKWIVAVSISLTVAGLLGFSLSSAYFMLFLFAVPYGLGAGAIDAAVNHYVANNYSGAVMNFLHCFYGVGAVISPNIMAAALKHARWNEGYRWTSYMQIGILIVVILSFSLWKKNESATEEEKTAAKGIRETLKAPGVLPTLIAFFGYCAGEATCFLWTSSYFAGTKEGLSKELVASFASLIFGGLMAGRIISGLVSNKLGDKKLIRFGILVEFVGIMLVFASPNNYVLAAIGFVTIGCGMGPVYPAIQHMAPSKFGKEYSASAIGLQMASAYVGTTFMPMVFGILQEKFGIWIMPWYILFFMLINFGFLELSNKLAKRKSLAAEP